MKTESRDDIFVNGQLVMPGADGKRRIKLWHPPLAPKPEPVCELRYDDVVFEIPCTLMHYVSGWLSCGMKGSCVPVEKAFADIGAAVDYVERAMLRDSTTPLTDDETAFYSAHGLLQPRRKVIFW